MAGRVANLPEHENKNEDGRIAVFVFIYMVSIAQAAVDAA
jgi:hypothetical protein